MVQEMLFGPGSKLDFIFGPSVDGPDTWHNPQEPRAMTTSMAIYRNDVAHRALTDGSSEKASKVRPKPQRQALVQTLALALTAQDDGVVEDALWRAQALLRAVKAKDHAQLLSASLDALHPVQRRAVAAPRLAEVESLIGPERAGGQRARQPAAEHRRQRKRRDVCRERFQLDDLVGRDAAAA